MLNDNEYRRASNIPIPLERSTPDSFKRLLGGRRVAAFGDPLVTSVLRTIEEIVVREGVLSSH
jgi:hypothetical protein